MAPGHVCYHCKQFVAKGEAHDCWTTTEAALTRDLSEDLKDAWERLRESAAAFGDQRIYASHNSIMFSRRTCYFFVRPKRAYLEVCFFLGRTVRSPLVRKSDSSSKTKTYHIVRITHRDQVEAPFTDWLEEAYRFSETKPTPRSKSAKPKSARRKKPGSEAGFRNPASEPGVFRKRKAAKSAKGNKKTPPARTKRRHG